MAQNLTHMVFGHLTVISRINDPTAPTTAFWWCRCSCGRRVGVSASALLSPETRAYNCSSNREGVTKTTPMACRRRPRSGAPLKRKLSPADIRRGLDLV